MRTYNHSQHAFILTLSFFLFSFGTTNCSSLLSEKALLSTPTLPSIAIKPVQATPTVSSTFTAIAAPELTPTQPTLSGFLFSADIEDPLLAEAIQSALPEQIGVVGFGGHSFCSYALLMPLQTTANGDVQAYLQVFCNEFYLEEGTLWQGTGISVPVAFTLAKQGEVWYVIESQRPKMGNWGESLREIFPPEALRLLINSTPDEISRHNAVINILYQKNIHQASEFYGLPFVPTPAG